jgi:hypothetical protein
MPQAIDTNRLFDPRNMPGFKITQPADIPVPNIDPMKVMETGSLTRMKKSYDEAQRQMQAASYDQLGQRLRRHEEAALVDLVI